MSLSFEFGDINRMARTDPRGFMAECDAELYRRLAMATARIAAQSGQKPIVLLSGPSGSGKTTTAGKIAAGLGLIGVRAHVISMDDYYMTVDEHTRAVDENGNIDYETPDILDIPLMRRHFSELESGREIAVPRFDFAAQRRKPEPGETLRLGKDEVAVFEGIHALNPALLDGGARTVRVYASARSNILDGGDVFFKGTWMRLMRRTIRDKNFRGAPAELTQSLWAAVRRGEKKYISPFKDLADIVIDTSLCYEVCALRDFALPLFAEIDEGLERAAEMREIAPKLREFTPIPAEYISKKSLLREFIGGIVFN
ncbi:MAG: nucleoside kinase [Oscillospiraceae bacterium]|jgi:uridine kinase|nr:nucleoside kinase [Oscillospiraceae bacterium]